MLETIKNWQQLADEAVEKRIPIIVMIDQLDCPFCRRVEGEFFAAIFASGDYEGRALFGKLSINAGETIVAGNGDRLPVEDFLADLNTRFTPTILFLDPELNELSDKMVGLTTPDYYGFYLERAIEKSIASMQS